MNLGCGSKVSRFLTTTLLPSSLDQVLGIIYLFRKQTTYVFAFSSNVYYLSWSLLQGHIRPHLIVFLLSTFQHSTFPLPLAPLVCRHSLLSLETIWRHIYWSVDCKPILFWTHCLFVHHILLSSLSVSWTPHKSWISEDTLFKTLDDCYLYRNIHSGTEPKTPFQLSQWCDFDYPYPASRRYHIVLV